MKEKMMPVLFIGHGSPMNAIENNEFTESWKKISKEIPVPKEILIISAHWTSNKVKVNNSEEPNQIYDMYGFPDELYKLEYKPKGSKKLATQIIDIFGNEVVVDNDWGIDHGAWSVLSKMYPKADIPVVELSINLNLSLEQHFLLGEKLKELRQQGVLIIGSGNIVHNLSLADWSISGGFPWAYDFDKYIKDKIMDRDFQSVVSYDKSLEMSKNVFHTKEHFIPLLYILGSSDLKDKIEVFNNDCVLGSISMTSYLFR